MTATAVIEHFYVFKQVRHPFLVRRVARGMYPFVLQAVEEALCGSVDAPMSSGAARIGQIGQNEGVQLPDDISLEAAMNLLLGHAFLRSAVDV